MRFTGKVKAWRPAAPAHIACWWRTDLLHHRRVQYLSDLPGVNQTGEKPEPLPPTVCKLYQPHVWSRAFAAEMEALLCAKPLDDSIIKRALKNPWHRLKKIKGKHPQNCLKKHTEWMNGEYELLVGWRSGRRALWDSRPHDTCLPLRSIFKHFFRTCGSGPEEED